MSGHDAVGVAGSWTMSRAEATDAEVIAASRDDPERLALIFRRHYRTVYRYVVSAVGRDDGPDVAAEVFVRAFAARYRFDPRFRSARPWLFGIAAHLVRDVYRARGRQGRALGRLGGRAVPAVGFEDDAVARVDVWDRVGPIGTLLGSLSPDQRDVVGLFALAGLSYEEIAQALGIPIGTVKSRLTRARRRLRNLIPPDDESSREEHGIWVNTPIPSASCGASPATRSRPPRRNRQR